MWFNTTKNLNLLCWTSQDVISMYQLFIPNISQFSFFCHTYEKGRSITPWNWEIVDTFLEKHHITANWINCNGIWGSQGELRVKSSSLKRMSRQGDSQMVGMCRSGRYLSCQLWSEGCLFRLSKTRPTCACRGSTASMGEACRLSVSP